MKAKLDDITTRTKKVGKHKDGRALRPLSAYNIFFQLERKRIMKEQGNPDAKHAAGGFESLASVISSKWNTIDDAAKLELEAMAKLDRDRYDREIEAWKASKDAAEAALKFGPASDKTEELPLREVVFDSEPVREVMSPLGFVSPLDLYCGQPSTAYDFPRMPFTSRSQGHVNPAGCSFGNAAAVGGGNQFVFNDETGTSMMRRATQPARTNLQGAPQVQASNIRFAPRPSFDGFQGGKCAPYFPSAGNGRRVSCPEVSAAQRWASNDSSQVMSDEEQDPHYMRGYIQGFKEKLSGGPKSSNGQDVYINQDGEITRQKPSYMRGYSEGFKAASEMCVMFNKV
ncbi:hypothetical protein ACHAWO_004588 [Cyclotella atomus]|uniref:HMG box domain-containing protein n=1 Tax=Cyclotella atomus TaxID=382360 RepID=A0ABD3QC93_9STRA